MRAVDILRAKRDGRELQSSEIEAFVEGATHGTWPDYQLSALLMAIVLCGMSSQEAAHLTHAMVHSGTVVDLSDIPGPKVDKHSTGGVGDKTSLILAPLASVCGVVVPMMSGRGLGHTGGTLDKLESVPGFRVRLTLDEFRDALKNVGCALIGQTKEIAPADRVLYSLRDVTATVESIPLICASILSKKIAEGIDALVLDVKCGSGAFMKTLDDARELAQALVSIGNAQGVRTEALITRMETTLGQAVGHSCEVIESIETLKGRGPASVTKLSLRLAADMVHLAGLASNADEAFAKVKKAMDSGAGVEKLRAIVQQQGGDPKVIDDYSLFPRAPKVHSIKADRAGYVRGYDAEAVGHAVAVLGGGRNRVEDIIDHAVGAMVLVRPGDQVQPGEALLELHYRDDATLGKALELLETACPIEDNVPKTSALIVETLS